MKFVNVLKISLYRIYISFFFFLAVRINKNTFSLSFFFLSVLNETQVVRCNVWNCCSFLPAAARDNFSITSPSWACLGLVGWVVLCHKTLDFWAPILGIISLNGGICLCSACRAPFILWAAASLQNPFTPARGALINFIKPRPYIAAIERGNVTMQMTPSTLLL